ncbi:MAG: glycosyltransferase family 4 protein [Candidatus Solibacter usitatus]|nr:glycosyltransferase family 4 protein [Candidatus Solibacter usitatus]
MNILFLDQFSDLGGAQQCLLDLIPAIHARGWRAFCGVPGDGPFPVKLRELGAEVSPISCGPYASGRKSVGDALRFARQLPRLTGETTRLAQNARADLIYVNGPRVLPAASRAARGRWPLVFHCHSRPSGEYAIQLVGRALRRADAEVIACSRFVAEPFAGSKLHVIYNGVRAGAPHRREPPPWRIGVIGRIAPENGQREFLQAARLLSQRVPGLQFVVCGAPLFASSGARKYAAGLTALASGLPVEFLGWRDDVGAVLAHLDILVAPSAGNPGAPRVILEAFAAGVPVVAFAAGGIPELVADGETGFLIEAQNPQALSARLEALLQHPATLSEAAHRALAAWKMRFTVERYQQEIIATLTRVSPTRVPPQGA